MPYVLVPRTNRYNNDCHIFLSVLDEYMTVWEGLEMMGVYLFGYTLGFASGALAYHWWLLGKQNVQEDEKVKICGCEVIPRKNVDGSMTVYVKRKNNKESCFTYSAYEAHSMTLEKLEKLVKEHLKKDDTLHGSNS